MKTEILFLIAARGGSKRVPGKNLKRLGDLSLVGFKARSAKKSRYCSRLVISTDSTEIQEEAIAHGAEVPFTRPSHLASDTATSDDVVLHAIEHFETVENRRYDAVMLLEPSSPFARGCDYNDAVGIYLKNKAALVVGMRQTDVHTVFVGPLGPNGKAGRIVGQFSGKNGLRTQDLEPHYTMNGAFYLIDWKAIKRTGRIYGDPDKTFGYPMDRSHSVEIDEPLDLRFAEFLVESGEIDIGEWR